MTTSVIELRNNSRSFLTNERPEDSKATPPRTTSFFPELDGGLTVDDGVVWVDGPAAGGIVVVGADVADGSVDTDVGALPLTFNPGRIYLFADL